MKATTKSSSSVALEKANSYQKASASAQPLRCSARNVAKIVSLKARVLNVTLMQYVSQKRLPEEWWRWRWRARMHAVQGAEGHGSRSGGGGGGGGRVAVAGVAGAEAVGAVAHARGPTERRSERARDHVVRSAAFHLAVGDEGREGGDGEVGDQLREEEEAERAHPAHHADRKAHEEEERSAEDIEQARDVAPVDRAEIVVRGLPGPRPRPAEEVLLHADERRPASVPPHGRAPCWRSYRMKKKKPKMWTRRRLPPEKRKKSSPINSK